MAQKGPTPEEIRLAEAKQLAENWVLVRQFMQFAASNQEVTQEHEQNFLRVRTEVSKLQRSLSQKLPPGIALKSKEMSELLKRIYSLSDIRNQPDTDRAILFETWHKVRISVIDVVGAMEYIAQGYDYDPSTRSDKGGTSISSLKGGKAKDDSGKKKTVIIIIGILLLAAAGYYFFA